MHVLILSHNYPYSYDPTFGFFCKQQADALVLNGHQVGVVCPLAYSIPRIIIRKKRFLLGLQNYVENKVLNLIFFFPSPPKQKRLKLYLTERIGIYLLNRYIRQRGVPDVLHLHVFYAIRVALYAKERYNIPVIWTEHFSDIDSGHLSGYELQLLRLASKIADARIAVSENFRRNLEHKLGKSFYYLPNVYNSFIFKYDGKQKSSDTFTFIHVANLDANKNQIRLLNAFKSVFEREKHIRLVIIGEGENYSMLLEYINANGLQEQVVLKGFMPAEIVNNELNKAHAFVLSSNYETFGVSVIEAMACGLPVVATRSGGPESIIIDNELGLLVEKDEDSLAKGMKNIHDNYSAFDHKKISAAAIENYSYEVIGAKLTQLYLKCK